MPKKDTSTNFFSNILESYAGTKSSNKLQENLTLIPKRPKSPAALCCIPVKKVPKKINTWENLFELEDEEEKSFSSESRGTMIVYNLLVASKPSKECMLIESIPFELLLNDLKLLIIGIESESFKRSEETLIFYATKNFSCGELSNISPILDGFLEAGTCFKRLKTYTSKNPFNQSHIFDGFIFRAFCDRIIIFLNNSRDTIYSKEVKTVLELYESTSSIRKILNQISKFLNIHPSFKTSQQMINPTGSDFLKLLYNEYAKTFNVDVKKFYVSLLKACCEVYYLRYQEWFYHGLLDDPHKELFIYYVDHYNPNTKYFFDKAYLIKRQSVPEFLSGCAENVLLCGKYTMLLKSYKPLVS
jgi:gamma-tubulin complex component 6